MYFTLCISPRAIEYIFGIKKFKKNKKNLDGLVTEKPLSVSTLHVALENGSNVHVNERQKIRHYRDRSTGEEE